MSIWQVGLVILMVVAAVLAVMLFNKYERKQYERVLLGGSTEDTLMDAPIETARDGKTLSPDGSQEVPEPPESSEPPAQIKITKSALNEFELLTDFKTLDNFDFKLFGLDKRFDYLSYIILKQPAKFHRAPIATLKTGRALNIIACGVDGIFKPYNPNSNESYQAFVFSMQAINRSGIADQEEFLAFGEMGEEFVRRLRLEDGSDNAMLFMSNLTQFLEKAKSFNQLCEQVDRIISIYTTPRTQKTISGNALVQSLTKNGFFFGDKGDASFYYPKERWFRITMQDVHGNSIDAFDTLQKIQNTQYAALCFDFEITRVPPNENNFDIFMSKLNNISNDLDMILISSEGKQLPSTWSYDAKNYIANRHEEMLAVGIESGSEIARRLFSY